ncbi:hypothetical protein OS670_20410 [Pseudomonadaceae bacterium T75]|nr:hypothetical protein OS670_20410 [Pseudomonadaceae bacterium T75]
MRKLFTVLAASLGLSAQATEATIQMQEKFDPSGVFSVMVPENWITGAGESFSASAPNNGPSLSGTAYRIESRPPLIEFAQARYQGVSAMGIYKQIGEERYLESNGSVVREYQGVWPGEKFVTHYVVACKSAEEIYACIALVTTKADYNKNRAFYEKMLSTFKIQS